MIVISLYREGVYGVGSGQVVGSLVHTPAGIVLAPASEHLIPDEPEGLYETVADAAAGDLELDAPPPQYHLTGWRVRLPGARLRIAAWADGDAIPVGESADMESGYVRDAWVSAWAAGVKRQARGFNPDLIVGLAIVVGVALSGLAFVSRVLL